MGSASNVAPADVNHHFGRFDEAEYVGQIRSATLLYAAGVGTDISRRSVGDATGWTGTTNERVPLTFLVWSPSPGVVLEITTTDADRPIGDLVVLAERTTVVPIADREARYPG